MNKGLLPRHEDMVPNHVEKWLKIGLSTEPADRPKAGEAARLVYELAGLKPPQKIVWLDSPLAGMLAAAIITDNTKNQIYPRHGDPTPPLYHQVFDQIYSRINGQITDQVREQVYNQVKDRIDHWVYGREKDQIYKQVRKQVKSQVSRRIWCQAKNKSEQQVWKQAYYQVSNKHLGHYGQHDAAWLAFHWFLKSYVVAGESLKGFVDLAENCGWWWPLKDVVILTERPNILKRDASNRLHCEDGPALAYPDGLAVYSWHGERVPERIITAPLKWQDIKEEKRPGYRKILFQRFGWARYIEQSGTRLFYNTAPNTKEKPNGC